tara:strand:+ start:2369 stop:3400 length:1032 start_codon:yes stop_codon:yes gene_type:complete
MGLEHTVTLLESRHYNRSQIISSIEKKSKVDKLTQTKGALNHLIEEVCLKLEKRRIQNQKEISPSPKKSIFSRLKQWWNSNYNHITQEYNGVQTLGESLDETLERLNYESKVTSMMQIIESDAQDENKSDKYKCWSIVHESNKYDLSREDYFKYFCNQNRRVTKSMGVTIAFIFLFLNTIFIDVDFDNGRYYAPTLAIYMIAFFGVLMIMFTPLVPRILRNTAFSSQMAMEIESLFGQSNNTEFDRDLENIRHLSLGQFFQPGDYLFRFVGYVSGNESNVLMLRKRMRGSSSLVSDYIDRFSQATLVAISIEEFVDLYTGKDLEKDDHGWSHHIVKRIENWNN